MNEKKRCCGVRYVLQLPGYSLASSINQRIHGSFLVVVLSGCLSMAANECLSPWTSVEKLRNDRRPKVASVEEFIRTVLSWLGCFHWALRAKSNSPRSAPGGLIIVIQCRGDEFLIQPSILDNQIISGPLTKHGSWTTDNVMAGNAAVNIHKCVQCFFFLDSIICHDLDVRVLVSEPEQFL